MESEGFKYDFNFETIVETEDGPIANSMRVIVRRIDPSLLTFHTSIDCGTEGVKKIGLLFGISDSTKLPMFELYVLDPETDKEKVLTCGDIDVNNGYEFIPFTEGNSIDG